MADTLYVVVQESSHGVPSVAQIKAGNNGSGTSAAFDDSATVSTTSTETFSVTGLTNGTDYETFFVWSDGTDDSDVLTGSTFTTYTTVANVDVVSASTVTAQANAIRYVSPDISSGSTITGQFNATKRRVFSYNAVSTTSIETDDIKRASVDISSGSTVEINTGVEKLVSVAISSGSAVAVETDDTKRVALTIASISAVTTDTDDIKGAVVDVASGSTVAIEIGTQGSVSGSIQSNSTITIAVAADRTVSPAFAAVSDVSVTLPPIGETLYVVVQQASEPTPSVAQVKGGLNGSGVLAEYKSYQSATTTSSYTFPALLSEGTAYESYFVWSDGAEDVGVLTGQSFSTISTIPVAIASESTTAITTESGLIKTVSVDVVSGSTATVITRATKVARPVIQSNSTLFAVTDDAIGRLYVVVDQSGIPDPSAAQIIAGLNGQGNPATYSASRGADSDAALTFPVVGLSEGTFYQPHYVWSDGTDDSEVLSAGDFQTKGTKAVRVVIDSVSTALSDIYKSGLKEVSLTIFSASGVATDVVRYPKWWNDQWWPFPFWRQPYWGIYRRTVTDAVVVQSDSTVTVDVIASKALIVDVSSQSGCDITLKGIKRIAPAITSGSTVTCAVGIKKPTDPISILSESAISIDAQPRVGATVLIEASSECFIDSASVRRLSVSIDVASTVNVRKTTLDDFDVLASSSIDCDIRKFGTQLVSMDIESSSVLAVFARLQWQEVVDAQNTWSEVSDTSKVWTDVSGQSTNWNEVN